MAQPIIDPFTGAQVDISIDHHYIHLGKGFSYYADTASLAAGAIERWSFKTPALGKTIHFRPVLFSSLTNSASVEMVEAAVLSGGTKRTPKNRNRLHKNTSKVELYTAATSVTAGVDTLFKLAVGTGGTSARSGGDTEASGEEWVLARDTVYDIIITNTGSVTATVATLGLFWYEE